MPTPNSDETWRSVLGKLEELFSNNETKLNILRKIDQSYFSKERDLISLLGEICVELVKMEAVESVSVGIEVDGEIVASDGDQARLLEGLYTGKKQFTDILVGQVTELNFDNTVVLKVPYLYKSNLVFLMVLVPEYVDHKDFSDFVNRNFFEQVKVLSTAFAERESRLAENSAYLTFFTNRLRPSASWSQLLLAVSSYLPEWSLPIHPEKMLKQLLIYDEGDEFLRIAAGNNDETGQYILADRSISGRLIKSRSSEYLSLDPSKEKDYLGYGATRSRSELAIRLDFEGSAVGVLNLEHPEIDAFSTAFREAAIRACKFLAPIVGAMSARNEANRDKERALLYVFTDMLSRMGDTYGHLVSQPLFTSRNSVAEIRYLIEQKDLDREELINELIKLEHAIDEFQSHSDDFTKGLPEFVSYGSQNVKAVATKRLSKFSVLASGEGIEIGIKEDPTALHVYASSLLQEHIFNIVNNSFQQIRKRIFTGEQASGVISIGISEQVGTTKLDDATGLDYVIVEIQDDGGGADDDDLVNIGKFGFTTKNEHGTGYGVAAAREYVESIGGKMTFGNFGAGFRTVMTLQKFNGAIHEDSSMVGLDQEQS